MTPIDIVIAALFLASLAAGVYRGFIREVLSLASWVLALWLAYTFAHEAAQWLVPHISQPSLRVAAAFTGIFVLVLLAASALTAVLHRLRDAGGISGIDRSLGMMFGAVRGGVVVSVLILGAMFLDFVSYAWWQESRLVGHLEPLAELLRSLMPPEMARYFAQNAPLGGAI